MANAIGLCKWCNDQLGQIYVWGGNGQEATPALIKAKEEEPVNYNRAMKLYNKRLEEGKYPILMYDCSGLISRYLQNNGIVEKKRNCNHLADMCTFVRNREKGEPDPGDLLFRWSDTSKFYHVGVYVGDGQVIESKGRDDGVVKRDINASGASYWNRWGRLACLQDETSTAKVLTITSPLMRGEDIGALQAALNGLGYPCGDVDGICGAKTMEGIKAFIRAHSQSQAMPDAISVRVTVGGREYKGDIGG